MTRIAFAMDFRRGVLEMLVPEEIWSDPDSHDALILQTAKLCRMARNLDLDAMIEIEPFIRRGERREQGRAIAWERERNRRIKSGAEYQKWLNEQATT